MIKRKKKIEGQIIRVWLKINYLFFKLVHDAFFAKARIAYII